MLATRDRKVSLLADYEQRNSTRDRVVSLLADYEQHNIIDKYVTKALLLDISVQEIKA